MCTNGTAEAKCALLMLETSFANFASSRAQQGELCEEVALTEDYTT